MDNLHQELEAAARQQQAATAETLYLNDYLERVEATPSIAANAHQRIFDMMDAEGKKDGLHAGEISYNFFADEIFGLDVPLRRIAEYFESAAAGHETRKRILLLWGPPGGAKSTVATMLKRGLENYSTTERGAVYALDACPMHEEPLHLIPDQLRDQVNKNYKVKIEGKLCPVCAHRLEEEFGGDFLKFPIKRIFFSESKRVGIGTFEAGDPKSMSMAMLTGEMDFKKAEVYGTDAHPLALDWAGEFSKANRGLFEAIEFFKNPPEFRHAFLTMAQEKQFKIAKFGYIDSDTAIIAHTNEAEFQAFMADQKNEALKDRLFSISVPYNVRLSDEVRIYEKLLSGARHSEQPIGISPHSLEAAAMVAILSRLSEHENLGLLEKLKLYNGEESGEWKLAQIPEIKREADREGMGGLGPRRISDMLSKAAIAQGEGDRERSLNPIGVLIALSEEIDRIDTSSEERKRLKAFVADSRKEIDRLLKDEVRKAFVPAFAERAQDLLENYLTNAEAYCQDTKLRDPITQEEVEPDEKLMRAIEERVNPTVPESAKDAFRQGVLMRIGIALRKGDRPLSYKTDSQLSQGIEEYLFEELKDVIRVTVSRTNPDPEQAKKLNEVLRVLVEDRGYSDSAARTVLDYVGTLLNR